MLKVISMLFYEIYIRKYRNNVIVFRSVTLLFRRTQKHEGTTTVDNDSEIVEAGDASENNVCRNIIGVKTCFQQVNVVYLYKFTLLILTRCFN